MSSRSFRSSGSPPDRPSWRTPSDRASLNTRFHSSVVSSASARISSSGLEQYGQCSGQRWVSSASSVVGRSAGTDQLPLGHGVEVFSHVGFHICLVTLVEDGHDVPHATGSVTELQDGGTGIIEKHGTLGI